MKTLNSLLATLPLLALLAACVVIAPRPTPPGQIDTSQFVALVNEAPCPAGGNQLYVIDNRYVFWERGPTCQDQVLRLYGRTPNDLQCIHSESVTGPYTNCNNAAVRRIFDTILANRKAPDLGLGPRLGVIKLDLQVAEGVNVVFETVVKEAFSAIHTRREVVIRDAAAWAKLWAEHTAERSPAPPLPQVDFSTHILVGIFAGDLRGCHEFDIRRVNVVGGRVVVGFEDRDITAQAICIAAITNPVHIVAIPRFNAEVAFAQIAPNRLEFTTIDRTSYSGVEEPATVIVRDQATWVNVWTQHAGTTRPVPEINFSTTMVVAVFRGLLPNGCYATEITDVYLLGPVVNVARVDTEPSPEAVCTLAVVTPAHLVAVPRSDQPVTLSAELREIP